MHRSDPVDVYKVQLLASSKMNNRLGPEEFQRQYHLLTEVERRALYETLEQMQGSKRTSPR